MEAVQMSLRGGRAPEPSRKKPALSFRLEQELLDWVHEAARQPGRDMTDVGVRALELDRDLSRHLESDVARIHTYADAHGLEIGRDLPRVLADLVKRGLDAYEREKKKR